MSNLKPGVRGTMLCTSDQCAKTTPGHSLRPLQLRVSTATPSKWRDGIVTSVARNGWIEIALIESGTAWVWNHTDLSREASVGTPVALHSLYGTLALGSERVNVLVAPVLPGGDFFEPR